MRFQLSDPALIREYVKTYREERNRAEGEARRKRSTLDRDYAKSKSEIQRIVSSIAKGLITDDEATSLLDAARREIARLESKLAATDSTTSVIELHPQAVQLFKDNVEALADILVTKDALPDVELIGTFFEGSQMAALAKVSRVRFPRLRPVSIFLKRSLVLFGLSVRGAAHGHLWFGLSAGFF